MNIFVGKLDFSTQEPSLQAAFEQFGEVSSASIIIDHFTGKSRGFGFVEMPNEEEAKAAIAALNETDFEGQTLIVKEADDRKKGSTFRSSYDMHYNSKGDRVPEEERERQRAERMKERAQFSDRRGGGGRRGGGYGGGRRGGGARSASVVHGGAGEQGEECEGGEHSWGTCLRVLRVSGLNCCVHHKVRLERRFGCKGLKFRSKSPGFRPMARSGEKPVSTHGKDLQ